MTRGNETFAEMGLGKKVKEIASYLVPVTGDMKIHRDFNELREDKNIRFLVLATSSDGENPGPIIKSLLSSKMRDLSIPIVLVPGSMNEKDINLIV